MTLKVVGAGLGRTGTASLKLALEEIGFGPCYHMREVFPRPPAHLFWERAFAESTLVGGTDANFDQVFEGFVATVDWPACHFWRELALRYPEAKVILSLRDPESWWESLNATIFNPMKAALAMPDGDAPPIARMMKRLVAAAFHGRLDDKDHVLSMFARHNAAVKAAIPKERLLVFQAKDGWEPLCKFLGVPVPKTPYPRTNTTEDFQAMYANAGNTILKAPVN